MRYPGKTILYCLLKNDPVGKFCEQCNSAQVTVLQDGLR